MNTLRECQVKEASSELGTAPDKSFLMAESEVEYVAGLGMNPLRSLLSRGRR